RGMHQLLNDEAAHFSLAAGYENFHRHQAGELSEVTRQRCPSYPRKRVSRLSTCLTNLDSRVRGNDSSTWRDIFCRCPAQELSIVAVLLPVLRNIGHLTGC